MSYAVNQKKIIKNTVALYLRMGITMVISFYTSRVTLEVLGITDFGLNNLLSGIVALFSFINASMGTAVQRFYSVQIGKGDIAQLQKTFGVGLYLHGLIAFITFVLLEIFALFFLSYLNIPIERLQTAHIVFQISAISLVVTILSVPYTALLRAREEFTQIAYIEIAQSVFRLLNLYFLYSIAYDKLVLLSSLNFAITFAYVVTLIVLARRYNEAKSFIVRDKEMMKEMFSFVSMLLVTVLASLFRDKGIIVLINLFFGLAINAAYAVAMQVMAVVNTFVMNFKQSIVPQMMAAYGAGDVKTMIKLINTGTKITFVLMAMITLPLMFEVDYILIFWLKTPPEHASILVILVLININISSFTYFLYQGVHATGKIVKQQFFMSVLYILNILGIWGMFESGADFHSALYVTIIISILQCWINCFFARDLFCYSIKKFIKNILLHSIVVGCITCLLLHSLINVMESSFIRLILSICIASIAICMLSYYFLLNASERNKVKVIVESKLKKHRIRN